VAIGAAALVVVDVAAGSIPAPSDLSAIASDTGVRLAWSDNATNESGFHVKRGQKAKGVVQYNQVGNVGPNITSYLETLPQGTYYFRVRAFGPGGVASEHSNAVNVSIKGKGGGKGGGKDRP